MVAVCWSVIMLILFFKSAVYNFLSYFCDIFMFFFLFDIDAVSVLSLCWLAG